MFRKLTFLFVLAVLGVATLTGCQTHASVTPRTSDATAICHSQAQWLIAVAQDEYKREGAYAHSDDQFAWYVQRHLPAGARVEPFAYARTATGVRIQVDCPAPYILEAAPPR